MKLKRGLTTVLVGLAMLATPIAAAAKDFHYRGYPHSGQYAAPAVVTRHDFRHGAVWAPAPAAVVGPNWRQERRWANANAYRNYGYYTSPGYAAPVYAAPVYPAAAPYYAGGYGGNPCGRAHSVVNNYYRDRATGHPAAAYSLLAQNRWAFNSGCGGGPGNGGGYRNYGGYGQPYGGSSMFGPLIQQYIR
jgi:hypothetical protein